MDQNGFLGTSASLTSDLTLLAYIFLLVPGMLIGFFFARRKWFEPHHKLTMTTITLLNWLLIAFVMIVSYSRSVAPQMPQGLSFPENLLPTIHLITGLTAQIIATYLVIRMWFENSLPESLKVSNIKRYMRLTLALWMITAALGITTYFVWYSTPVDPVTPAVETPVVTPEASEPIETPEAGG